MKEAKENELMLALDLNDPHPDDFGWERELEAYHHQQHQAPPTTTGPPPPPKEKKTKKPEKKQPTLPPPPEIAAPVEKPGWKLLLEQQGIIDAS